MKVLVVDNYDSFTYNLVHYVCERDVACDVVRNDKLDFNALNGYDKVILSPGPGIPEEAGDLKKCISILAGKNSILGVCLGHQAIVEVFGGRLQLLDDVYHGIATEMTVLENSTLFDGLPKAMSVGRYHSWVADRHSIPPALNITAEDVHGAVMAVSHRELDIHGVQFHPESILTPHGKQIIWNFLNTKHRS